MERHTFKHRQWTVEVFCKRAKDGLLIPLRYNIYYDDEKVNSLVGKKHRQAIDEAIHEIFRGKIENLQ